MNSGRSKWKVKSCHGVARRSTVHRILGSSGVNPPSIATPDSRGMIRLETNEANSFGIKQTNRLGTIPKVIISCHRP